MRILVVSDTHGQNIDIIDLIKREDFDIYIHLGDFVDDAKYIEKKTGIHFVKVKGNNDFFVSDTPEKDIIEIEGYRILLVHGHRHGVYYGIERLETEANIENADICLFGHTHVYYYDKIDGIIYLNPGSPSRPRGGDFKKSCALIEIENREVKIERILL